MKPLAPALAFALLVGASLPAAAGEFRGARAANLIRALRTLGFAEEKIDNKVVLKAGSLYCLHDSGYQQPESPMWTTGARSCWVDEKMRTAVESEMLMTAMAIACLPMDAAMGSWTVQATALSCSITLGELDNQKRFSCTMTEEAPDPSYCAPY